MSDKAQLTNEEHHKLAVKARKLCRRKRGCTPVCPYCENKDDGKGSKPMKFRHRNIHKNPLAWGQNWKCPRCYLIESFGIPLTREEYEEVKEIMGGRHYNGKPAEDLEEKEIKKHLEELGYLEME